MNTETETPEAQERQQEIRKSMVRIRVTYFVTFTYCSTAVVLTFVLLFLDQTELAIGVFSGLSTLSAGIAGFWFGTRGTGFPEPAQDRLVEPGAASGGAVLPDLGTARRPFDTDAPGTPAVFEVQAKGDAS